MIEELVQRFERRRMEEPPDPCLAAAADAAP